jgi:hypothetical protein
MELPALRLPGPLPTPLPALVTAVVDSVRAPGLYAVRIQSLLLELELDLFLEIGDRLPLRVKQQSSNSLVLEVLPREAERPSREPAGPAPRPEPGPVERELLRQRAPLDSDLVARLEALPPGLRPAAAFLAAHGLEPLRPLVEALARMDADPASAAVARLLETSPKLRTLDALIEGLVRIAPREEAPPPPVPGALLDTLLRIADADDVPATLAKLPPLPRPALDALREALLVAERAEIERLPALREAVPPPRPAEIRLVNQLSELRGDDVLVADLPVRREDGRSDRVPLRWRRERSPDPDLPDRHRIVVHADLARLGLVHAFLVASGRLLQIRLAARDARSAAHLTRHAAGLVGALEAAGFEAVVAAEVAAPPPPSLFDLFADPDTPGALDLHA